MGGLCTESLWRGYRFAMNDMKSKNISGEAYIQSLYAVSNRSSTPREVYKSHENMKKHFYQARIREVEHGTFTPLIFSVTGGMSALYKHLASLLSDRWTEHYAAVMGWLKYCLSFSPEVCDPMC